MRLTRYNSHTMKSILALSALLLLTSCDPDIIIENSCQEINLETSFEMKVGDSACLSDGRSFRLLAVKDQFCPCGILCDFEGELILVIETEDLNENEVELEIGSSPFTPDDNLFEDVIISNFTYKYNGADDTLPLCQGTYNQDEITIILSLSTFESCVDIEYDTPFEMAVGSSVCLPDGRRMELMTANDSFCPCLAVCVWEGQLDILLETTDLNNVTTEVFVGSNKNTPHGDAFEDVAISDFTYLYNGADDTLPLCEGTFDENEITIVLTLTQ